METIRSNVNDETRNNIPDDVKELSIPETHFDRQAHTHLTEQTLAKLRMDNVPPTGAESYACLQNMRENEHMQPFGDYLKWYNNEEVVPTLEAMQIMIEFYHNKGIDMLKLGKTLPNLAKICLHKSTDSKFYPFAETDKDWLEEM